MRALALMLMVGCGTETVTFPPDLWEFESTTSWNSQPIAPQTVRFGCDSQMTAWQLDFETRWWTDGADGLMHLYTADAEFIETHPIDRYEEQGDQFFTSGPLADGASAAIPGQASVLDCETDRGLVAVVIELNGGRGRLMDCAWSGPAFDSVFLALGDPAYEEFGGCLRFEM